MTVPAQALPFRLRLPVCAAPMFLVSGPEMVVAACTSGIAGAFPTQNARSIEELDCWLDTITRGLVTARTEGGPHPVGPWVVNLVTHSTNTRLTADLDLVARYRPPVVITALGSPRPVIETVHGYGGIVIADVTTMTLARKAIAAGADGLACVCAGAGGHTGALSPFAFVSAVRGLFDGIVIAGGGIADGWGVAGAVAAGADLVYMGTRFIASRESLAPDAHKALVVSSSLEDLVVTSAVTGAAASWLRPSLESAGVDPDASPTAPAKPHHDSNAPPKKRWKEIFSAGQGLGQVRGTESVGEIVERLEVEYVQACARFSAYAARFSP